jgi:hypothetical protein
MGFLKDTFKIIARGVPTKPKTGSNIPPIKTDVKKFERVTPLGVVGDIFRGKKMGSQVPEAGIKAKGDWRKTEKPNSPERLEDDSIFSGKPYVTRGKRMEWLKKHKAEIYEITKRRVTENELSQFDKELFGKYIKPDGTIIKREVFLDKSGAVPYFERDKFYKAKTDSERFDIKEDVTALKKMLDLDRDKNKK